MKKIIPFVLLVLLSGCSENNGIPYVYYEQINKKNITLNRTYYGFIDRGLDVDLSFGISGHIKDILINEGERVKKGQLLAYLDDDDYKYEINRADIKIKDANIRLKRLKSYAERVKKLYEAGGISFNEYENSQTELKSGENQIKIAAEELNSAKKKAFFAKIFAPYDGRVLRIYKDESNFVYQGEKVILYQGNKMLEGRVFVPDGFINSIKLNEPVSVKTSIFPNKTFNGIVKSTLNTGIDEGGYRVTVSIQDDEALLDGMNINVTFADNLNGVIILPKKSIIYFDNSPHVFILNKNTSSVILRKIDFKILDDKIFVLKGVEEGEFIVLNPDFTLKDNQKVKYD